MVRHIPNKYTQAMLLEAITRHHLGKFDLLYLPVDFRHRCNVGYAFINLISPAQIPAFYAEFHGHAWAQLNSRKVCEVAYARIQSKAALIAHFESSSSSFMRHLHNSSPAEAEVIL